MRAACAVALALLASTARAERLELEYETQPGTPKLAKPGLYVRPVAVKWVTDDGRLLWRRPLDKPWQAVEWLEQEWWDKYPEKTRQELLLRNYRVLARADAVALAVEGRLLVLDRSCGAVLLEGRAPGRGALVHPEKVTVVDGGQRCESRWTRAAVLLECNRHLYLLAHFGGVARFATDPYRALDAAELRHVDGPREGCQPSTRAVGALPGATVDVIGCIPQ